MIGRGRTHLCASPGRRRRRRLGGRQLSARRHAALVAQVALVYAAAKEGARVRRAPPARGAALRAHAVLADACGREDATAARGLVLGL
eukprot:602285-Prymnesium_polylepis.3